MNDDGDDGIGGIAASKIYKQFPTSVLKEVLEVTRERVHQVIPGITLQAFWPHTYTYLLTSTC